MTLEHAILGCLLVPFILGILATKFWPYKYFLSPKLQAGLVVVLVSSLVRLIAYFQLLMTSLKNSIPSAYELRFYTAIENNVFEYMWHNTLKPPLNAILPALTLKLFSIETAFKYSLLNIPMFAIGVLSTYLLYLACVRVSQNKKLSLVITLIWSLKLLQLETVVHVATNYDLLALHLIGCWVYSLVELSYQFSRKSFILCALFSSLLIIQSTIQVPIIPIVVALIVFLKAYKSLGFKKTIEYITLILAAPLLLAFSICLKNYFSGGFFAPSNLAGATKGQFAIIYLLGGPVAYEKVERNYRIAMKEVGVPDWYQWCFDHVDPTLKESIWFGFERMGGICFPISYTEDAKCWPFDPRPLHEYLVQSQQLKEAEIVQRDVETACNGKNFFAGMYPLLSSRWLGYYGQVTSKVVNHLMLGSRQKTLNAVLDTHKTFLRGPEFLAAKSPLKIPFSDDFYEFITFLFRALTKAGYAFVVCSLPFILFPFKSDSSYIPVWRACTIAVFMTTLFFCGLVGWEQDRYFLQVVPFLLLLSSFWLNYFYEVGERIVKRFANVQQK